MDTCAVQSNRKMSQSYGTDQFGSVFRVREGLGTSHSSMMYCWPSMDLQREIMIVRPHNFVWKNGAVQRGRATLASSRRSRR